MIRKSARDIFVDVKENIDIFNNFQQTSTELEEVCDKEYFGVKDYNKLLDEISLMFDEAIKKKQCSPNVADWILKEMENALTSNSSSAKAESFNTD